MAADVEKIKEQARKDAEKARATASKVQAGGSPDVAKIKAQAQADAAKARNEAGGGGGNIMGVPGTSGIRKVGGGVLGSVVSALGMPQQAVFRVGSGIGQVALGDVGGALEEFGKAGAEVGTLGQIGGNIGFAEATTPLEQRKQGLVRKLPKGVETTANLVLDPLLPTAFSKAAKAKGALKAAESAVGAKTGAKLTEGGIGVLSQAERSSLRAGLEAKAAEVGATGGRRSLAEIAQGAKRPASLSLEEGAERTAAKNIKLLEGADRAKSATAVGRVAERLPAAASEKLHLAQGVERLKTTKFAEWADDAVRPRAAIIRNYGDKLAEQVKALGGERFAKVAKESGEVSTELQARLTRLGRDVGVEDNKLLGAALRGESWAVDTIKGTDLDEVFQYAVGLEKKTGATFDVLKPAKAAAAPKPKKLAAVVSAPVEGESYARAKLREILARRGQTPEDLGITPGVAAKPGASAPAVPGRANLDELTKTKIGDENPLRDVLNRNFQGIHGTASQEYATKFQAGIKDPESGDFLLQTVREGEAIPEGWVRVKANFMGEVAAPPEIAKEIDRLGRLLDNDKTIQQFDGFLDKFDRLWKSAATSVPVGLGFTARNARSNLFLNWLDGLYHVGPYKEALAIQNRAKEILKGGKFADEITAKGLKSVMKEQLTPRQFRVWNLAMDKRVLGSNYFDIDMAFSGLSEAGKIKGVKTAGGPGVVRRGASAVGEQGKKFNSAVEDNAKLANFIHNLDRYGDADIAAQHVHKFLFDYADLTPFEQRKVRKLIPFYTFMRKNVPLQIEQTFLKPGQMSLRLQAGQAVTEDLPEGAPSYLERGGATAIPSWAQSALGAAGKVALSPDNPLTAAAGTIDPFLKLGGAVPAILRGEAPESLPAEVWRPLIANLGGGRGSPLKALFEEGTQTSAYTGGELPPEDVRGRVARALIPLVPRMQGLKPKEGEAIRQFLVRQAGFKLRDLEE